MIDELCGILGHNYAKDASQKDHWFCAVHEEGQHCPRVDCGDRELGEECKCDGWLIEAIIPILVRAARGTPPTPAEKELLGRYLWKSRYA